MSRVRHGLALLEVLVAMTILATAAAAMVSLVSEGARVMERVTEAERRSADASAFLEAVALWTRDDLDRRLGERVQGPWRLRLERPHPAVYTAMLIDTITHRRLLETALYRPRVANEIR